MLMPMTTHSPNKHLIRENNGKQLVEAEIFSI